MPDPDLKIRSGGGGGAVSKKIFWARRASVWSKNKGEPGSPRSPRLRYATEDGQASEASKKQKNVVEKALLPSMIRTFRWIND